MRALRSIGGNRYEIENFYTVGADRYPDYYYDRQKQVIREMHTDLNRIRGLKSKINSKLNKLLKQTVSDDNNLSSI